MADCVGVPRRDFVIPIPSRPARRPALHEWGLNSLGRASQFSRYLLSDIGIVEMDKNVRAGDGNSTNSIGSAHFWPF